ncbi:hypothetical protein CVT26_007900 [Gymnopilus dilepis]|uniref:Uncharacterized protein n=1 Tax=Gymnopilus dilepis TaxID=231916 RepID=A0A409YLM6_9AGAR|nr:hypothetical protein CVT26_007900 [Gymnopilus dilepis]
MPVVSPNSILSKTPVPSGQTPLEDNATRCCLRQTRDILDPSYYYCHYSASSLFQLQLLTWPIFFVLQILWDATRHIGTLANISPVQSPTFINLRDLNRIADSSTSSVYAVPSTSRMAEKF